MSYVRRQQEYFALPNRHIVKITVVADLHHHVALQLVKEFLDRVVMIIGAFVWRVTNTQQTYRPLTNTSQPALRDRVGRLAAVSNGPFGIIGPRKLSMISTTSARAT